MLTFQKLYSSLRRKNRRNYALLVFCDFISVMLITSYAAILRSPTVLRVLPEGGDSRRQMYMIFALAAIGCAAFTLYAGALFLRFKSREMGIFLALGASKPMLRRTLYRELALLSALACAAGAAVGIPLAMGIWQLFRLFLVNTEEMTFHLDASTLIVAAAFSAVVILALFVLAARFIRRTNVMEIINEQRQSETVREVPRWFGAAGILLSIIGALAGYFVPSIIILHFHYYPWGWENVFYLPLLIGIYMILLHTVVNGWRKDLHYKNIITHSMMKFQGRQTVNNMLVMTLLLAGAYFASFYTPTMMSAFRQNTDTLHFDGLLHAPFTETIPTEPEIRALAEAEGVEITAFREAECVLLGVDGERHVEEGRSWHKEYEAVVDGRLFFPASGFAALTGETVALQPGEICTFVNTDGTDPIYGAGRDSSLLTNTVTGETLKIAVTTELPYTEFASKAFILNDSDFDRISRGLPDEYRERWFGLNFTGREQDGSDTYPFARRLYDDFIDSLSPAAFHENSWNLVGKAASEARGERYEIEEYEGGAYGREHRNNMEFRQFGKYTPTLRILDSTDALEQVAVFVTVFMYVAVICYLSVILIGYTRCKSLAVSNAPVYEDLRRLGASGEYLRGTVRSQIGKVYAVPATVGAFAILFFFTLILYANDGCFSPGELRGLLYCILLLLALSTILWACCRFTLRSCLETLRLRGSGKAEI